MKTAQKLKRRNGSDWILLLGTTILSLISSYCFSQDYKTNDTVHVDEIVISGESISRFQSGAKIEKIESLEFELNQDGNLEQLLGRTTPIAFKTTGGSFSTMRIRGTSPDHTSINFGGININSLTLGHSNTSNVPLYLFDEVGVQYGSASTVQGSGSIGGAIHLGLKNYWTKGIKSEIRIAYGSFGEKLYGAKIFEGNGKFESATRFYYFYKENDFTFMNPNIRDFENGIFEIVDTQHNAQIENFGLIQEFNYKINQVEVILFNVWLEKDWHNIQQNMATNISQPNYSKPIEDNHIRSTLSYRNRKNAFKYQANAAFVFDKSIYNNNTDEAIKVQRYHFDAFGEHDFLDNASYKIGVKTEQIRPMVYAYSEDLDHENRLDFYASYFQEFRSKLKLTINLRQSFVSNFEVPFTPSLGLNYIVFSRERTVLNLSGNIAKSFRVPTFNDRFWVPGGNPDLKPEKGINYELGSKFYYCDGNTSGSIKLNAFYMDISDWILWRNGGAYWYAENVQDVISKGFETMINLKYKVSTLKFHSGINYTLTSTQRKKSENNTNALNRQMEYVPLHSGNIYTTVQHKKLSFTIDGFLTDKQFTNEEEDDILDATSILNFYTRYKLFTNSDYKLTVGGLINNITNVNYQSTFGYAMPGINYRISLTFNYK